MPSNNIIASWKKLVARVRGVADLASFRGPSLRAAVLWRPPGDRPEVTTMELFFDLAYVFAITQLTSTLHHSLTVQGVLETAILFGAIWWVWNYTAWTTSWIDPERLPVRLFLAFLMLLCLVMSSAIPEAFAERGLQFAGAVAAVQVIRPLWMIYAMRGHQLALNYVHVACWSGLAAALWIVGALTHGHSRVEWWVAALLVDVIAPVARYRLPWLGRRPVSTWPMSPSHLGERCRLILIIALGETVLGAGRTFTQLPASAAAFLVLMVVFVQIVALWWLYFARHADEAVKRLSQANNAASAGVGGYNYAHAVLVGALVVIAVGVEFTMEHPFEPVTLATASVISGGVCLYGIGISAFTAATGGLDRTEQIMTVAVAAALISLVVIGPQVGLALIAQSAMSTVILLAAVGAAALHAHHSETGPGTSAGPGRQLT